MPAINIETWARGRARAGFALDVPEGVVVERPPSDNARLRAVERRPAGKVVGELDVSVFWPSLLMDRDGVLCETVTAAAAALLAPPRVGHAGLPCEILLPAGPTWRVDVVVERDESGARAALPFQIAMAIGHPDLRVPAALFLTVRSITEAWSAGVEMLESLRFAGRVAATRARAEGLVLTS